MEKIVITVRLDPGDSRTLAHMAADRGVSKNRIIESILKKGIQRHAWENLVPITFDKKKEE